MIWILAFIPAMFLAMAILSPSVLADCYQPFVNYLPCYSCDLTAQTNPGGYIVYGGWQVSYPASNFYDSISVNCDQNFPSIAGSGDYNSPSSILYTFIKPLELQGPFIYSDSHLYYSPSANNVPGDFVNTSIPLKCWGAFPDKLVFNTTTRWFFSGGSWGAEWSCWNGSDWQVLDQNSNAFYFIGGVAMWWNSTYTNSCISDFYCSKYGPCGNYLKECLGVSDKQGCGKAFNGSISSYNLNCSINAQSPDVSLINFDLRYQANILIFGVLVFFWLALVIMSLVFRNFLFASMGWILGVVLGLVLVQLGYMFSLGFLLFDCAIFLAVGKMKH